MCGQPTDESTHPDAEGKYRVRRWSCHACNELAKARQDLREAPSEQGIHLIVERAPEGGTS